MKFLILNRRHGGTKFDHKPGDAAHYSAKIKAALDSGDIEVAYVLIGGGHAYVVNAESSYALAVWVRGNPLFDGSDTEIIPIELATVFLDAYAEHVA